MVTEIVWGTDPTGDSSNTPSVSSLTAGTTYTAGRYRPRIATATRRKTRCITSLSAAGKDQAGRPATSRRGCSGVWRIPKRDL